MNATASLPAESSGRKLAVISMAYLLFIVLGMPDGMLGVVFPLMRQEFSLGLDSFGIIFIFTTAGYLVSSFTVGLMLNRFRTAHVMAAAAVIRTIGLIGYALLPSWAMIVPVTLLVGFASGIIDAGMNTWFAMRFSPRLMNWLHASFGLGATLSPLVITLLIANDISWRWGFVIMAALQITLGIIVLLTRSLWDVPAAVAPNSTARVERAPHISPVRALLIPAVWLGIAVFFFYTGVELTSANWAATIFTEGRGLDLITAGRVATAFWATFTFGRIFFGFLNIRNVSRVLRLCLLGALTGAVLLAWAPAMWVGIAGLILIGFSTAPVFPLLVSETPMRLGAEVAQHAIGFQVGAAGLGIAVIPSVAGVLAQRTSLEAVPVFISLVALVLILLHELMIRLHAPNGAH